MSRAHLDSAFHSGKFMIPRRCALSITTGKYAIKSTSLRDLGCDVAKGYYRADFIDAWTRYLPDDEQAEGEEWKASLPYQ